MSGWQTALDNKLDALDWCRSEVAKDALSKQAKRIENAQGIGISQTFQYSTVGLEKKLMRATPMYVHPDILDLTDAALHIEDPEKRFNPEPLLESDVITPWCFISLPRTTFITDARGNRAGFSRVLWAPAVLKRESDEQTLSGMSIVLFSTLEDASKDDYHSKYMSLVREAETRGRPDLLMRLSVLHATAWEFGGRHPNQEAGSDWYSWLQILMRLSMQQISTHVDEQAPRGSRRRAKRIGLDHPSILVVKLRRSLQGVQRHGEFGTIDHEFRWMVSGHWRNQWYPSIGEHRQIYIADHVKGPEDKPLRLHAGRALELVR